MVLHLGAAVEACRPPEKQALGTPANGQSHELLILVLMGFGCCSYSLNMRQAVSHCTATMMCWLLVGAMLLHRYHGLDKVLHINGLKPISIKSRGLLQDSS